MDKIAEVKKVFLELDTCKIDSTVFWAYYANLKLAINALDEPELADLSDLRVGDEVESFRNGWGTVSALGETSFDVMFPCYKKVPITFWSDGRFSDTDIRPSIIAVRRKPRMVKKVVKGWIVLREGGEKRYTEDKGFWERNKDYQYVKHIVPVSGEYEEEEEAEGCSTK